MCLGIQNITYYLFYQRATFLRLRHCAFRGNVIFLILLVYKLLHCNITSKEVVVDVVVVSYYSSSWWSRDYFQGSWFSPGMCIRNELISHPDLSLPFKCVFIWMSRLAQGPVAWQALGDTGSGRCCSLSEKPRCCAQGRQADCPTGGLPWGTAGPGHTLGFCHVALPPQVTFTVPDLISCLSLLFSCRCWDGWRRSWFAVELREAWRIVHPLLTFEVGW